MIAERERAEGARERLNALSEVNQRIIEMQEQERARIARELHDDISQRLALLTLKLARVSPELGKEASDLATDLQALSRELHPSKIEILGVGVGLKQFCRHFADQRHIRIDFEAKDALHKLERADVVTVADGHYRAVGLDAALEKLERVWMKYARGEPVRPIPPIADLVATP